MKQKPSFLKGIVTNRSRALNRLFDEANCRNIKDAAVKRRMEKQNEKW
jgi:hypothetical protein